MVFKGKMREKEREDSESIFIPHHHSHLHLHLNHKPETISAAVTPNTFQSLPIILHQIRVLFSMGNMADLLPKTNDGSWGFSGNSAMNSSNKSTDLKVPSMSSILV